MKLYGKNIRFCRSTQWLAALPVVMALALSLSGSAWAQDSHSQGGPGQDGQAQSNQIHLPDGIPNLADPQVGAGWQGYQVGSLNNDPDLPLLMFVNTSGNQPAAMMFGVDARNGKETFSLASDPVILVALFSDPQTVTRIYYDQGFSGNGHPSGQFAQIANPDQKSLPDLLATIAKADQHSQPTEEVNAEEAQ